VLVGVAVLLLLMIAGGTALRALRAARLIRWFALRNPLDDAAIRRRRGAVKVVPLGPAGPSSAIAQSKRHWREPNEDAAFGNCTRSKTAGAIDTSYDEIRSLSSSTSSVESTDGHQKTA